MASRILVEMRLVEAEHSDYQAVTELVNLAYRGTQRGGDGEPGWTCERELVTGPRLTVASLANDLNNKPQAHLLLYRESTDEALSGTVWLEPKADATWYLGLLTVRPDLQDRQLGRGLLTEAEAFARVRGGKRIRMTVLNARETLIAWYGRRGYKQTGETEAFPYEDARFGKALRADLRFLVLEKAL